MRYFLCILLLGSPIFASQITKVSSDMKSALLVQDEHYKFQDGDKVCIYRQTKFVGCGVVAKAGEKFVKMTFEQAVQLQEGDDAYLVLTPDRKLSSIEQTETLITPTKKAASYIGVGLNIALDRIFPKLEFITNISSKVSLGLQVSGTYARSYDKTSQLTAYGISFTANYYSQEYFRGLWLQVGSGTYLMSENSSGTTQYKDSPVIMLSVGWREHWALGFNIGVAGGIRYISFPAVSHNDLNFQKLQPSLLVDFGFTM